MSHRNGRPKPSARKRTVKRWKERHEEVRMDKDLTKHVPESSLPKEEFGGGKGFKKASL